MMEAVLWIRKKGVSTIGCKSQSIAWARLEGRNGGYSSFPGTEPMLGSGHNPYGTTADSTASLARRESTERVGDEWGSVALGLCECSMWGIELPNDGCCYFIPSVCTGFSDRRERMARKAIK